MKTKIPFLFVLLFSIIAFAQTIYIPFKKGNKFGISDEKGKIVVEPQFDMIRDSYPEGHFLGINFNDKNYLSSFIINNKVIIKNQDYTYYNKDGNYIIATKMLDSDAYLRSNGSALYTKDDLYNINGKKLLKESYNNIIIIDEYPKPLLKNELLILTQNKNLYSLQLLNNKNNTISKTYFQNAIDVDPNYDNLPKSLEIKYINNKEEQKLTFNFVDGKIINVKNEKVENSKNNYSDSYNSSYYSPPPPTEGVRIPNDDKNKPINYIKEVQIRSRYITPENLESIYFSDKELNHNTQLKSSNNKWGYYDSQKNIWIIEPEYDEIIAQNVSCSSCSIFTVKKDGFYRLLIKKNNETELSKGSFKLYPLLVRKDFMGKKGFDLIKLFDEQGNFVSFANNEGKIYTSE